MELFGFEIGRAKTLDNVVVKQKEVERIIERITRSQLQRSKQDIGIWRSAINQSESAMNPKRTELIKTFKDVVLDAHLSSLIQTRILKVVGHDFSVVDSDGEIDIEKTKLFRDEWFEKFVNISMESIFWGYSLIQFGALVDDKFESVESVPREYIIPEKRGVMKRMSDSNNLIYFDEKPFKQWLIFLDSNGLGLLNKATPHAIWKKNAVGSWAEYVEKYGQPTRVGKTHSSNKANRENLESMLANMGSNGWAVFDNDDELQFLETSKTDAHSVFNEMVSLCNSEMSKLIVGQTMTSDNGSSRSQATVHENILNDYFKHDLMYISNIVNNKLIPLMVDKGVALEGFTFEWDTSEKMSISQQFAIDNELLKTYTIQPEYFIEKYGVPVETKQNDINDPTATNVYFKNSISKYYE